MSYEEKEMLSEELTWTGKDNELKEYLEGLEEAILEEQAYVAMLQENAQPFFVGWQDI